MAKVNLPVVYSQLDSRWAQLLLGFNTQLPYNFYNYACLISSLAMVAKYFGKDWDPVKINDDFKKMGPDKAFVKGSGNYVPGGFHLLFGDIEEKRTTTPSQLTDAQMGEIKNALDNGYPVMVGLDVNPKTVAYDSHFVLLIDYNPSDENDFTIADPIGGKIHSLKDYLGWFKPSARSTIEQYTIFKGPKPVAGPEMIVVGKDQWDLMRTNHDKWHQVTHYLDGNLDPNATSFDQVKSIIAGIKSRSTDMENKANEANSKLAVSQTEVSNRVEQVGRLEKQLLDQDKANRAQIDALIKAQPDLSKVRGEYEGQIKDLQGQVDGAKKEVGETKLELAACQATPKADSFIKNLTQKILDFISSVPTK